MEHTLPWHVSEQWAWRIYDANGYLVAEIQDLVGQPAGTIAELIVKAVNSHDELLEACKAASIALACHAELHTPTREKLEQAIFKGGGE